MTVFSKTWFAKHQKQLLWFANTWIGRYVLRIHGHRSKVGKHKIETILPNAIAWREGENCKAEFRTHDKFGKRLYYAFKPIWNLFHLWDQLTKFNPKWNLGFDTFGPVYPDAGEPAASACDGYVGRQSVNETWATIIAGAGNVFDQAAGAGGILTCDSVSTASSNQYSRILRMIILFNTAALPDAAVISAATESLYGADKSNGLGSASFCLVNSTPGSNTQLANSDYGQVGNTEYAARVAYASWTSDTAYIDMALNATGLAAISKTGITKTGGKLSYDLDGTGQTWANTQQTKMRAWSADTTGTSKDPSLTVTYTLPSTVVTNLLLLGVG